MLRGQAVLDLLGPRAALSQGAPGALRNGRYEQNLRHSLMWVISIGTNEIQRSAGWGCRDDPGSFTPARTSAAASP